VLVPHLVEIVEPPASGSAVVTAVGAIRYQPPAGFTGSVFLRYTATNSFGEVSEPARLNITVTAASSGSGGGGGGGGGKGGGGEMDVLLLLAGIAVLLLRQQPIRDRALLQFRRCFRILCTKVIPSGPSCARN
jgi:hypothetical protein